MPQAVGTSVVQGRYLNAATAREPVAVLGAAAAQRLGVDRVYPGERIWLGGQWFYLAGSPDPASMNWLTPCPATCRTALARNSRFARAIAAS